MKYKSSSIVDLKQLKINNNKLDMSVRIDKESWSVI